ncbi:hypothetical protein C1H46_028384 [Malus baccata]|uniref:Heme O synthase n=1 Tax=Malus baccata TaxID=106549 RepID=A0A540LHV0_MALBA|nr:hypothetical protein C1H46_028384 [Malus baccata]
MWKRVVQAPSAQLQTLASQRSSCLKHSFRLLIFSPSSSSMTLFQRYPALSSTHATLTSCSSASAFMGHEHEEFEAEHQSRINTSKQSGMDNGYYSQNSGQLQQKLNGACADGSRDPQYSQSNNGIFWRSTGNEFMNDLVQQNGNFRGYYGHENRWLQKTPNLHGKHLGNGNIQNPYVSRKENGNFRGYYGHENRWLQKTPNLHGKHLGNGNIQNPYVSRKEPSIDVRQNPDDFNSQVNSGSQGNHNQNSMQSYAQYRQNTNGYSEMHQPNPNYGQHQQNSSYGNGQYQQHPSYGPYQQNPSYGQYQTNSGAFQNTIVDSHIGSESKSEAQLIEASEDSLSSSSLEELDRFCKEGKVKEAVEILGLLEKQHVHVDLHHFLQLMQACSEAKALEEAKVVHDNITRLLPPLNVSTYNKILEMYSKCGSMDNSFLVFNKMPNRNLTSWDIMITWFAKNGLGEDAIDLFTQFKKAGLKPDGQLFIGVLYACSVVGDINEGLLHFESMSKDYGIVPNMDHYVSVVDMLGSTGYLDEALEFIEKMPLEPNVDVWKTLMNHCRVHGQLELGDRCAELIEQLDPSCLDEQSKAGLIPRIMVVGYIISLSMEPSTMATCSPWHARGCRKRIGGSGRREDVVDGDGKGFLDVLGRGKRVMAIGDYLPSSRYPTTHSTSYPPPPHPPNTAAFDLCCSLTPSPNPTPTPLPLRLQILSSSGFTDPMESERFRQRLISRRWLPGPRTWPATMGSAIRSSPKLASVVATSGTGFILGSGHAIDFAGLCCTCAGTMMVAASANSLNQVFEKQNDAKMNRTKNRPLPSGRITIPHAVTLASATGLAGTALLASKANMLAAGLGASNLILYAFVYTPLKQIHPVNTWVGAVVGAIPPLLGWAAASGQVSLNAMLLPAALYFWQIPHFMALAYLCRNDYAAGGYELLGLSRSYFNIYVIS